MALEVCFHSIFQNKWIEFHQISYMQWHIDKIKVSLFAHLLQSYGPLLSEFRFCSISLVQINRISQSFVNALILTRFALDCNLSFLQICNKSYVLTLIDDSILFSILNIF